jgi:3D (Asp-Asp-Asp) domain-containing protein
MKFWTDSLLILSSSAVFCLFLVGFAQEEQPLVEPLSVEVVEAKPVIRFESSISLGLKLQPEAIHAPFVSIAQIMAKPQPKPVAKPKPYRIVRAMVTAYCPCARCCGTMTGVTATQSSAWRRGAAVDPRAIDYGTKVEVPGYGTTYADDTGRALKRRFNRGIIQVDVRKTYHWQAQEWGIQWLDVTVYK